MNELKFKIIISYIIILLITLIYIYGLIYLLNE